MVISNENGCLKVECREIEFVFHSLGMFMQLIPFFFIYAFVHPVKFMFLHNDTYTLYFPDQKLFVFFTSREYATKFKKKPSLHPL